MMFPTKGKAYAKRDLPKCRKHEMLTVLPLHDGMNMRPFVAIRETYPENTLLHNHKARRIKPC
jgi:hypothetical protein